MFGTTPVFSNQDYVKLAVARLREAGYERSEDFLLILIEARDHKVDTTAQNPQTALKSVAKEQGLSKPETDVLDAAEHEYLIQIGVIESPESLPGAHLFDHTGTKRSFIVDAMVVMVLIVVIFGGLLLLYRSS